MIIEYDEVNRSFGTSYALGKVWSSRNFKGGSKLLLHMFIPSFNNAFDWGGGATLVQYSVNGGSWETLGNTGFQMSMGSSAQAHSAYSNMILFDPNQQQDYTIQFRYQHRSFTGTVGINNANDVSGKHFKSHLIIEEI